jgi:hypothetical protein
MSTTSWRRGMTGITLAVALGAGLMTGVRAAAAAPGPEPSAAVTTPAPAGPGDTRTGGSEPAPGPGRPGWVWWVTIAFVAVVAAGTLRVWRGREQSDSEYFSTEREPTLDTPRVPD